MVRKATKLLTEVEFELMDLLWRRGEASVRDVLGDLPQNRVMAYTSAATIFRILEQKGAVRSRVEKNKRIYSAKFKREEFERRTVDDLVDRVFQGAPSSLVKTLVERGEMTAEQRQELISILSKEDS